MRHIILLCLTVWFCAAVWGYEEAALAQEPVIHYCSTEHTCRLSWEPAPESDMSHYKLYWGNAADTYNDPHSPFVISHPAEQLTEMTTALALDDGVYYFSITAVDTAGNESDFSNEVAVRVDRTVPGAPRLEVIIE